MKKPGYLVWINDDQFWHTTLLAAQKRTRVARTHGKDTVIVGFCIQPYLVEG
jgi:hypothetical protein